MIVIRTTALAALLTLAGATSATAAPQPDRTTTRLAEADSPVKPVAVEAEDEPANCSRSRRRLWVEGEGWVVRRITTCR